MTQNPGFRGLDRPHLLWMFSAPRFGQYHPLTWISFAADFLVYGMNSRGFHLTNLLIHSLNAALFCLLAGLLLEGEEKTPGAVIAALVFALHPLRVETVAWAAERRGLLSALFLLGSLIAYLLSCRERQDGGRGNRKLVASLLCYALSLFSKASGAPLPAVLLLLDYGLLRRTGERKRLWLEKAAFAGLALPFVLLAPLAQWREGALQPVSGYGLVPRLGQAAFGSLFYLWKTIFPVHLSPLYDFAHLPGGRWLLGAAIVSGALTLYALSGRRPAWTASWGAYLLFLTPVLGLLQAGPHFAADRYTYVSCWSWALAAGAATLWIRRKFPQARAAALAGAGGGLLALSFSTRRQIAVWHDPLSLSLRIVQEQPLSAIGRNNLCAALRDAGRPAEAEAQCLQALVLRSPYPEAQANLGNALADQGKLDEAIAHYKTSLAEDSGNASAHKALGRALSLKGRFEAALPEFQEVVRLRPDDEAASSELGMAYSNRSVSLLSKGESREAEKYLLEALRVDPRNPEAENHLGVALFMQGRSTEALEHFHKALDLRPDYADARFNLARAQALLRKNR